MANDIIITAITDVSHFCPHCQRCADVQHGREKCTDHQRPGYEWILKELKKHKFTILTGVNTLFNGLLNNPDFKDLDFSDCTEPLVAAWLFRMLLQKGGRK